jgi:hypothetical protein
MWIGDYSSPRANLPGIDLDAANARQIAASMGVPAKNIIEVSNSRLTHEGFAAAFKGLTARIAKNDKVLIYYSGHGWQIPGASAGKCTQGMVSYELDLYRDVVVQADLDRLAAKASQVIMINDSCFSGGLVGKYDRDLPKGGVPKFYEAKMKRGGVADPGHQCGNAVNEMARNLVIAGRSQGARVLYIAAAAENEVAYASRDGSIATQAWLACIAPTSDAKHGGVLSGAAIQACAQQRVKSMGYDQTVTLIGDGTLPMSLADAGNMQPMAGVNPDKTLASIRSGADADIKLELNLSRSEMRIGRDTLAFTVSSNRSGYLYILHVGTSGKNFDLLFPNTQDTQNLIQPGEHRLPRGHWQVKAGGPVGTGYLMAYLSDTPKDFGKNMMLVGPFGSTSATHMAARDLYWEAVGANVSGAGRYGTSAIVQFREVP